MVLRARWVVVPILLVALAGCGGSGKTASSGRTTTTRGNGGSKSGSNSGDNTAAGANGDSNDDGSSAADRGRVLVTGTVEGQFDKVSKCFVEGGSGEMTLQMTGEVGGQDATLTINSEKLELGTFRYPTKDATSLGSDVLPKDPSKGTWQFFPREPANIIGGPYAGGVITITEVQSQKLDVLIGAQYGTTDGPGPIRLDGEFICQQVFR
jgi:hypothetical protein